MQERHNIICCLRQLWMVFYGFIFMVRIIGWVILHTFILQSADFCFCLFWCFTSQVNSYGHGGTVSSLNHTFSWASLNKQLTSTWCTLACNWQQPFLNESAEGRRMTIEIISRPISMKVWDWARIELATPGSAVRLASVARHITDCAMRPGQQIFRNQI